MSSSIIDNYINFIQHHDEYFKHYNTITDVPKSSLSGWLYIFLAKCYDENPLKVFDELVDKFGKTIQPIFSRLYNYEVEVEPTNIECIHCTLPNERERLIKAFLKYKTSIKPVIGHEYFIGCRNLIKILMLIMVHTSDEEIKMYEKYYAEKNKKEVEIFFNKVELIIQKIKEDDEFELHIEIDKYEEIVEPKSFNCNFCNKSFASIYNLNYHQKTAKFCLDIQNKNVEIVYNCNFCNKSFNVKSAYNLHILSCKEKKSQEEKEEHKLLLKKIKELEKTINQKDKIIGELKSKLLAKDETIRLLEKTNNKLIDRPTTIVNNANTTHTNNNYQIQYNQLLQNTEPLLLLSLSNKIKSITIEEMDNYDPKNLEDSVSHTLSNRLKDYAFCTDKSRKMVVIKKENDETEKITIKEFINMCLNTGLVDIQKFLKTLEEHYDSKLVNYTISDENFTSFDDSLQKIKEYMNKTNIDITDIGHPLKMLPDKVLSNCRHLNK